MMRVGSAYVLQYSAGEFGGMVWSEQYVVSTQREVRQALEEIAASPPRRRQYAFGGESTVGVWVVQRGHVKGFVDLRPTLSTAYDGRRRGVSELIADDPTYDPGEAFEEGELPLFVDGPAVEALLPVLEAPILAAGETLELRSGAVGADDGWLACVHGASYGHTPNV